MTAKQTRRPPQVPHVRSEVRRVSIQLKHGVMRRTTTINGKGRGMPTQLVHQILGQLRIGRHLVVAEGVLGSIDLLDNISRSHSSLIVLARVCPRALRSAQCILTGLADCRR